MLKYNELNGSWFPICEIYGGLKKRRQIVVRAVSCVSTGARLPLSSILFR